MSIAIDKIKVFDQKDGEKTIAIADIIINDEIVLHGCRLIKGQHGNFVGLPSRKDAKTEKWMPTVKVIRDDLKSGMLTAFQKAVDGGGASAPGAAATSDEETPF